MSNGQLGHELHDGGVRRWMLAYGISINAI